MRRRSACGCLPDQISGSRAVKLGSVSSFLPLFFSVTFLPAQDVLLRRGLLTCFMRRRFAWGLLPLLISQGVEFRVSFSFSCQLLSIELHRLCVQGMWVLTCFMRQEVRVRVQGVPVPPQAIVLEGRVGHRPRRTAPCCPEAARALINVLLGVLDGRIPVVNCSHTGGPPPTPACAPPPRAFSVPRTTAVFPQQGNSLRAL